MEGVDFDETCSPILKFPMIHIMLTIVVSKGWEIRQLDIDNAFLNGNLREVVYMVQPPSFVNKGHPAKVC